MKTILINRLLLISAAAAGLQSVWDFLHNSALITLLDLSIVAWLLLLFTLNTKGYLLFVRWAAILSLSLMLMVLGSFIPRENGLHMMFLPLLGATFFLFDYPQHWAKIISCSFILGCYLLLELYDFKLFGTVSLLEAPDRISFIANFFTASVLLYLILSFITRSNALAEMELTKMAQEAQEQNELLSQTNEELDRFVYSTSHDLRAPLLSISGLLQLIENKPATENIKPYLSMMQGRIRNLATFIDEITLYARNARTPLQLSSIALQAFIQEVLDSHRYLHQQDRIELRQHTNEQAVVVSDSHRLLTIINNLVSNALKYHRLEQDKPFVAVGAEIVGEHLHLWVEDNGPGIAPSVQERMFEMFYRGDERSSGSGLGLYIVSEALEKLGGTIEVSSILGQGSTFHVWLPLLMAEEPAREITEAAMT